TEVGPLADRAQFALSSSHHLARRSRRGRGIAFVPRDAARTGRRCPRPPANSGLEYSVEMYERPKSRGGRAVGPRFGKRVFGPRRAGWWQMAPSRGESRAADAGKLLAADRQAAGREQAGRRRQTAGG